MGAAGTGLAFAPFVPWGTFLPNPSSAAAEKVPVVLPDGSQANVFTFPINHVRMPVGYLFTLTCGRVFFGATATRHGSFFMECFARICTTVN